MIGANIKALNTSLLGGREMDDVTFYTLANLARLLWEGSRPWRLLTTRFNTNTSSGADTYTTQHALPSDFLMCTKRNALTLENTSAQKAYYIEVPLEDFDNRRNEYGLFAVDLVNSCYYLSGSVAAGTWTHKMNYTKRSPLITATVGWIFADDYAPYIAYEVAVMNQLGIDYDDTNARQGAPNATFADMILKTAVKWDDALLRSALTGVENRVGDQYSDDWRYR